MLDKFLYNFFAGVDWCFDWLDDCFRSKPKVKKPRKKKKFKSYITEEQWIKQMLNKK